MLHLTQVVERMRAGGYWDHVMSAGPELDRVKAFLRVCAGEAECSPGLPLQRPHYPRFPGLRNMPWRDASEFPAARHLEAAFPQIREEAMALDEAAPLDYSRAANPTRSWKKPWTLLQPDAPPGTWTVYLLNHMGVDVEPVSRRCPRTRAVLDTLPGGCSDYAWCDYVFSAMGPGAHLRPHCSIDNMRVRLHLGVSIPEGCSMRVGSEIHTWTEGKCLAFEESFEHEVWNRSDRRRVVLIADVWHPDLTPLEIRALTAAFRKPEVRRLVMVDRISMTNAPQRYLPFIEASLEKQDRDPVVREFWPA